MARISSCSDLPIHLRVMRGPAIRGGPDPPEISGSLSAKGGMQNFENPPDLVFVRKTVAVM